jgi:hypothetical protein
MTAIQRYLAIAAVFLIVGNLSGYWFHGKLDQAAAAKTMKTQVDAANAAADKRVADEQAAKKTTEDQLTLERNKTADLNGQLAGARSQVSDLQGKITNATFTPTTRQSQSSHGAAGVVCPAHPVSSPEFVQLYNSGSEAGAPSPASGGASPSGVPKVSVHRVRRGTGQIASRVRESQRGRTGEADSVDTRSGWPELRYPSSSSDPLRTGQLNQLQLPTVARDDVRLT